MSDSSLSRRQPPSPLVFSPETVLPPIRSHSSSTNAYSVANTVSMPFVRRHVTRRLKAAKEDCDKELQRVTNSITAYFEEKLKENEYGRELEREQRDREREREREQRGERDRDQERGRYREPVTSSPDCANEPFTFQPADLRSALQSDDASSDGGYEVEIDRRSRHSRQPSRHTGSTESSSPAAIRRQPVAPEAISRKHSAVGSPPVASLTTHQGLAARRLSRTIHIPVRPQHSAQSSRSTSRSRSPLPPPTHTGSFSDAYSERAHSERGAQSPSANRRSSRILVDDPVDPIMSALYEIIALCTDVVELSVAQLTAKPKTCAAFVQRVQAIGKAWDDHPDWHGRNWYVQVLLAVASLSRVVEWWEAEKQFWNFDDHKEGELDEPLQFVTKFAEDEEKVTSPLGALEHEQDVTAAGGALRLTADDESRLRLSRPPSNGRRSRDEAKDLATSLSEKEQEISRSSKLIDTAESARVLATERLRLQAETAQNRNIVIELDLDGDHFIWINYAWRYVVGSDPEELVGSRVSRLLDPSDWNVFKDATMRLQEDDSHTVEVKFRLRIESEDESRPPYFQLMDGKGMLMIDREDGHPSHTMWVIKPAGPTEERDLQSPPVELEAGQVDGEPLDEAGNRSFAHRSSLDPVTPFPFSQPINTSPILCRICECNVPQWYFEKHNETCSEVHRLEADIAECNESLSELRSTIRELIALIDRSSPATTPEYRGMPIFSPSTSPNMGYTLSLFRGPLSNKVQRIGVKKMQRRLLEQLDDILLVALEVSIPALREDESKEPIERQTLLSPGSERKMSQVRNWFKPNTEDTALKQLIDDGERVMRQKMDNVVRMRNTIKYSEKVRQEWEDRVLKTLSTMDEDSDRDSDMEDDDLTPADEPAKELVEEGIDDASSTKSEYAYNGDEQTASPTPMASLSPTPVPTAGPKGVSPDNSPVIAPRPAPAVPLSRQGVASLHNTRSSTPSSISSPLALVPPIVASPSPPPPMDLNDGAALNLSTLTLRTQRSTPNFQPKLLLTPPVSPMPSPKDTTVKRPGRRQSSAAQTILSPTVSSTPLSPRLPSVAPLSRTTPTSIKDFDIIKPISKGAFGSVFLARKKATGDYFAIKVLKKADMIAKNQVTNVKAERMILMTQAESPFVAKLYFTFQSKENLYLVMEYLNGGDCAALVKTLGSLPEEWAKNYIAEVVLGLESLHQRGIVHRDLKPDNLLIDQHGHLKLTDFGLSRIGLLGRQTREAQLLADKGVRSLAKLSPGSRPPSMDLAHFSSPPPYSELLSGDDSMEGMSLSDSQSGLSRAPKANESPMASFATELTNDLRSYAGDTPPGERKFVGTPDYLAPETILGLRGDDAAVDWWALGVITYEFLYGMPPFHDETPEKVFENILAGHIDWHEDLIEYSDEARDFMQRLMSTDPATRLGANGADEVKGHAWFSGFEWDKVTTTEAAFIPQVTDPESTDYFDPRGAIPQLFHDDDLVALHTPGDSPAISPDPSMNSAAAPVPVDALATPLEDGFGSFNFKNLPVLKQANDDVIKKLRTDQMVPMTHTLSEPSSATTHHTRKRSISQRIKKPPNVNTSFDPKNMPTGPPSPATSTSSIASSPSRTSLPPSTPAVAGGHMRKLSEYGAVERFKLNHIEGENIRRPNSMPSRLRTASVSTSNSGDGSVSSDYNHSSPATHFEVHTPPSSVGSLDIRPEVKRPRPVDLRKKPDPQDKAVTCLLAEDNPITAKILETLLIRLGCRCVVVADGSEAISVAMGDIKFDCILMDLHMPVLDGEGAARYIKTTNSKNTNTPIVAVSAYSGNEPVDGNSLFAAALAKPVQKADLLAVMRLIGFKTSSAPGNRGIAAATKVTAAR